MKRQFFALGLAALGGFAIIQPAMALGETENNTVRAENITGYSRTTGNDITGRVTKSGNPAQNDATDMFAITVPQGKTITVQSIGAHPNNVQMQLIRDNNRNSTSDSGDFNEGFFGNTAKSRTVTFGPVTYIVKVSLQDPRADVPQTNYQFRWFVK